MARLLVRLFISGSVIAPSQITGDSRRHSPQDMTGLRDVLIMATQSSAVAKAMLQAALGPNLDRTYTAPSGIRLLPESALSGWQTVSDAFRGQPAVGRPMMATRPQAKRILKFTVIGPSRHRS